VAAAEAAVRGRDSVPVLRAVVLVCRGGGVATGGSDFQALCGRCEDAKMQDQAVYDLMEMECCAGGARGVYEDGGREDIKEQQGEKERERERSMGGLACFTQGLALCFDLLYFVLLCFAYRLRTSLAQMRPNFDAKRPVRF
jgi:hypothetical protein